MLKNKKPITYLSITKRKISKTYFIYIIPVSTKTRVVGMGK